jgi:serine/threonine-protein kinase RsbW
MRIDGHGLVAIAGIAESRLYCGRHMSFANTSSATSDQDADNPAIFDRSIQADMRLLAGVRADLRTWLALQGVTDDDGDAIVLACSEAIANAIEHAYRNNADGVVVIAGQVSGASVEISVHDQGAWIPANPAGGSELRGRGLTVIAHLMDAAAIDTRDGTTILMRRERRV